MTYIIVGGSAGLGRAIAKKIASEKQDLIIICDVGAYGMSLASNYNVRPLPAEILVKNSNAQIIRNRQKLSDLI